MAESIESSATPLDIEQSPGLSDKSLSLNNAPKLTIPNTKLLTSNYVSSREIVELMEGCGRERG